MPKVKKNQTKTTGESKLFVSRNHDYTISIVDRSGHTLKFRDITGYDLEFLDLLLLTENNQIKSTISLDIIIQILSHISVTNLDFKNLSPRILQSVFKEINKHILCNYVSKYTWLKVCYGIQNGSFMGVAEMEKVPMTKFIAMSEIHKDAIDSMNKPTE